MDELSNALPRGISFSKTLPGSVSLASQWRQLYEGAILELDLSKLRGRITEAQHAILDRAQEILTRPSCHEHHALITALRALRLLEEVVARERDASKTAASSHDYFPSIIST
jgi:hypothetical protein